MSLTTSRQAPSPSAVAPLALLGLAHVTAAPEVRQCYSLHDHDYYRDLLASFGRTDEPEFSAGRTSYTDLVAALLPALGPGPHDIDLAIMASAGPDAVPGSPMCFLHTQFRSLGLSFAVGDQGLASVFTALHLLGRWRPAPRDAPSLLFIVDQASNPTGDQLSPHHVRYLDQAVVLVLGPEHGVAARTGGLRGRMMPQSPVSCEPSEVGAALAVLVQGAASQQVGSAGPILVRGHGLEEVGEAPDGISRIIDAGPGAPASAPWKALGVWVASQPREDELVIVADYDQDLGIFAACQVQLRAALRGER